MSGRRRLFGNLVVAASLAAGCVLAGIASAEPEAPPPGSPAGTAPAPNGAWQQHKYTFNYMGFTSTYTCDGLEDKLRLLLRLTGAESGYKVRSSCARGWNRPDRLAMADLTFSSLKPTESDAIAAGEWRHVQLSPQHPFDLGRGDCELVEEFRDRILPLFTVRNLVSNVTCIPYQDSGTDYSLSYDVYAPITPQKTASAK